jgi:hypothetical protein
MPLSEPAARKKLHDREIRLQGYHREDGLFDIEAEITDTKTYAFDIGTRHVTPGTKLHHMRARLTINAEMEIVGAEAVTEAAPFSTCGGGAASFAALVGLVVRPGVLRAANERMGGVLGCTHIREMLQQMCTVAFQTTFPMRSSRPVAPGAPPRLLNTCHAYASDGEMVRERHPQHYTGSQPG